MKVHGLHEVVQDEERKPLHSLHNYAGVPYPRRDVRDRLRFELYQQFELQFQHDRNRDDADGIQHVDNDRLQHYADGNGIAIGGVRHGRVLRHNHGCVTGYGNPEFGYGYAFGVV